MISLGLAIIALIFLFIILIIAGFFLVTEMIALIQTGGVPYVPSFDEDLKVFKDKFSLDLTNKKMLDLGCGDGKALRFFKKNFGLTSGTGYDLNKFAILYGRLLNKYFKLENLTLINKNFKTANLKEYDYIYIYLFPKTMKDNEDWVFENISDNTIIISNSFKFEKHQPYETIKTKEGKDRFFFYKK